VETAKPMAAQITMLNLKTIAFTSSPLHVFHASLTVAFTPVDLFGRVPNLGHLNSGTLFGHNDSPNVPNFYSASQQPLLITSR